MKFRNKMLFAIMVFIWGSTWPVMKMGLNKSPPLIFVSYRLFFSSVFLSMLNVMLKPNISRDLKVFKKILVYSLVSTFSFASTSLGLVSQGSGIGAVLTYTQPIMVFILAVTFLNEPFSFLRLLGITLGFSGVAALFLEDAGSALSWATLLLLAGAFLWAAGTVYYKRKLQNHDAAFVNLIQGVTASAVLYVMSFFTEPIFQSWDWSYIAILGYAGIGASGIGMTIWLSLLKDEEATSLSSSSLIVPVLALLFGWLLMGEELNLKTLVGSVLVIVGIYMVNHNSNRQKAENSS